MAEEAAESADNGLLLYLIDMAILEVERQAQYGDVDGGGPTRLKQYLKLNGSAKPRSTCGGLPPLVVKHRQLRSENDYRAPESGRPNAQKSMHQAMAFGGAVASPDVAADLPRPKIRRKRALIDAHSMSLRMTVSAVIASLRDRHGEAAACKMARLEQLRARRARSRKRFDFWTAVATQMQLGRLDCEPTQNANRALGAARSTLTE